MNRFVLSPAAKRDLDDIWNSSHANWGIDQAETYLLELGRRIALLAAQPSLGRACSDIRMGYFKYLSGSHVIFYRQGENRIVVVRILHERMDLQRHL